MTTSTMIVDNAFSGFLTVLTGLFPLFELLFGVSIFLFAFWLLTVPLIRGIKSLKR